MSYIRCDDGGDDDSTYKRGQGGVGKGGSGPTRKMGTQQRTVVSRHLLSVDNLLFDIICDMEIQPKLPYVISYFLKQSETKTANKQATTTITIPPLPTKKKKKVDVPFCCCCRYVGLLSVGTARSHGTKLTKSSRKRPTI